MQDSKLTEITSQIERLKCSSSDEAKAYIARLEHEEREAREAWSEATRQMIESLRRGADSDESKLATDLAVDACYELDLARRSLKLARQELEEVVNPNAAIERAQRFDRYVDRCKKLFISSMREVEPGFAVDDDNRQVVQELFFWALNVADRTSLDCNKGLLLCGSVGSGKTTLLRGLRLFLRDVQPYSTDHSPQPGFGFVDCQRLTRKFARGGGSVVDRYSRIAFCFDELGRENQARHFGNSADVLSALIQTRYDKRLMTHFSTNMEPDDLAQAYGTHVYDRIRAMCNFVRVSTEVSRRDGAAQGWSARRG